MDRHNEHQEQSDNENCLAVVVENEGASVEVGLAESEELHADEGHSDGVGDHIQGSRHSEDSSTRLKDSSHTIKDLPPELTRATNDNPSASH